MNDWLRVEGHDGLRKDLQSGGVINVNQEEYINAIKAEQDRQDKIRRLEKMEEEVAHLKAIVSKLIEARDVNNS